MIPNPKPLIFMMIYNQHKYLVRLMKNSLKRFSKMFCHQKVIFSPCNIAYKFWFIFHGPKFITNLLYQVKVVGETLSEDKVSIENEEIKRHPHPISLFSAIDDEAYIINNVLKRHNNWRKYGNILAWCKKFCTNARQKARNKNTNMQIRTRLVQKMSPKINYDELHLHPTEVTAMENLLFRYAQSSEFVTEITNLKNDLEIPKDSKLKKIAP